jgi:hypothetical protein
LPKEKLGSKNWISQTLAGYPAFADIRQDNLVSGLPGYPAGQSGIRQDNG